ncbi:hypothetical protein J132_00146 [Termitomyces sp. J132]|nr:hypothetical protein J132_00146 [Termitomyces sp. J132]
MRRRRLQEKQRQDAIAAVYQIEPSQIQGPPTTYVTSFDTRSPAGYPLPPSAYIPNITRTNSPGPPTSFPETPAGYAHTPGADSPSDPRAHNFSGRSAGAASAKRVHFPPTEPHYQGKFSTNKTPQTAPANPAFSGLGAYPFPGYSPVSSMFGSTALPLIAASARSRDRHSLTPLIRSDTRDSFIPGNLSKKTVTQM